MAETPIAAAPRQWKGNRQDGGPQSVDEFKRRQYQKSKLERAMEIDRQKKEAAALVGLVDET